MNHVGITEPSIRRVLEYPFNCKGVVMIKFYLKVNLLLPLYNSVVAIIICGQCGHPVVTGSSFFDK